jgi:hypothetical protein
MGEPEWGGTKDPHYWRPRTYFYARLLDQTTKIILLKLHSQKNNIAQNKSDKIFAKLPNGVLREIVKYVRY